MSAQPRYAGRARQASPLAKRSSPSSAAVRRTGSTAAVHPPLQIELQSAVRRWTPSTQELTRWAGAALGSLGRGREISVRIVGPKEGQALNERYRGRSKPTNVLSFPAAAMPPAAPAQEAGSCPLGDLVICAAVVQEEARAQGKALRAHWAHLVVHGALHLAGYDHEEEREAVRMERLEIRVLKGLGFPNPYRLYPSGPPSLRGRPGRSR